jgi:hypothetical protein
MKKKKKASVAPPSPSLPTPPPAAIYEVGRPFSLIMALKASEMFLSSLKTYARTYPLYCSY